MPDKKQSVFHQARREALQKSQLRRAIKIDHDVAAKNGGKLVADGPRWLEEIQLAKTDQFGDLWTYAHHPGVFVRHLC